MKRTLAAATLGLLALLLPRAWAQETPAPEPAQPATDVVGTISKAGAQDLPIAVPLPIGDAAGSQEIWEVVRNDLAMSGFFDVQDPQASLEPPGTGIRTGEFKWEDWEPAGTVVLAKTGIEIVEGQVQAEVWVYDVPGRERLGAKRISAPASNLRHVGHRIADEIINQVTGEPGPFSSRFVAVNAASGNKEITLVDVDGHNPRALTRNGSINTSPSWDGTGTKIAYTSWRSGNPDLYVADLSTGKVRRVSSRSGINTGAAWHPGKSLIALTLSAGGGNTDLYLLDPDNGTLGQRLTNAAGIDVGASFSPDGQSIAFSSERSGGLQIYVVPATGGDAKRVTFMGSHNTDPDWSPTGDRIAFVGRDSNNYDLFTVTPDGRDMKRLTQGEGSNEDPTWSPDGRYIAFSSSRAGGRQIWMTTADGRHQVQVTTSGKWSNIDWSPRLSW